MTEQHNDLVAYRIGRQFDVKLIEAPKARLWMNDTRGGFANRCLPMRTASQAGWFLLNDRPVRAKWSGGSGTDAIQIECDGDPPFSAISHFGEGILSFIIPYLFRTPPGVALWFRGPANMPKDAIAPLEAIVETDWAVASSSINWKFTRPNTWITFEHDEPICMVVPQRLDFLESFDPKIVGLNTDPATQNKYNQWNASCFDFNAKLRNGEPEAVKQGWQKYYFTGSAPHANGCPIPEAANHRTQIDIKPFVEAVELATIDIGTTVEIVESAVDPETATVA